MINPTKGVMSQLTVEELQQLLREQFSQCDVVLEKIGSCWARVRVPIKEQHLRPGGTVSGPTMMTLADTATYLAILAEIGPVVLAVTTNLTINFMRKPESNRDVIGEAQLLKLGRRLAVAEVRIYSEGESGLVAHATCTYSIPPH